jgi:hypothetical protein
MGFTEPINSSNTTFVGVSRGFFTIDKEPQKSEDGRTLPLEGVITNVEEYSFDYQGETQKMVRIYMTDLDGKDFQISAGKESKYIHTFLRSALNADLNKNLILFPYNFEDENGKTVLGINIYQDGQKVAPKYTKDNPCPVDVAIHTFKGKDHYDFTKQIEFMIDELDFSAVKKPEAPESIPTTGGGKKVRQDDLIEAGEQADKANKTTKKASKSGDLPF